MNPLEIRAMVAATLLLGCPTRRPSQRSHWRAGMLDELRLEQPEECTAYVRQTVTRSKRQAIRARILESQGLRDP